MAVAIAGLVVAAVGAGYNIYQGEKQKAEARDLRDKYDRPVKSISPAVLAAVRKSRFEASKYGLPGQGALERRADETTAASARRIKEAGLSEAAIIAGYSGLDKNARDVETDLGIEAARAKERAQGNYINSLWRLGDEQDKVWDYNLKQRYDENAAAASALYYAGNMNEASGIKGLLDNTQKYLANSNTNPNTNRTTDPTKAIAAAGDLVPGAPENTAYVRQPNGNPYLGPNDRYDMPAMRQQWESVLGPMKDEEFNNYFKMYHESGLGAGYV